MTPPTLQSFNRIVFFTGAGLSAESGVPTYRGHGGIWRRYNFEDYACQDAFDRDPNRVWDFHDTRRASVAACEPNSAHRLIAGIQQAKPHTTVITQNVDGLLQRAGVTNPIELHGSLWRIRCDHDGIVKPNTDVPLGQRTCACGAYWRPDIVWFGDCLSMETLARAESALRACDCLVSIGTSAVVYPAAALPQMALEAGAVSIEVNLEDTPMTRHYQYAVRGRASEALRALWSESGGAP